MVLEKSIGNMIRVYREAKGLSQNELVERLIDKNINMSRETISKIENNNRTISAIELNAICSILEISIEMFFNNIEEDEDLVTLFRGKGNFSSQTYSEIECLQKMIKIFINQRRIFNDEYKIKKKKPLWEEAD